MATLSAAVASGALATGATSLYDRLTSKGVDRERNRLRAAVLGGPAPAEGGDEQEAPDDDTHRFAALLIEYYAYGLIQARRTFGVSLACSVLGGLVLMAGVALAIFKAGGSDGQQYASVVASVAGVLTTAIGTLFHRRADRALKHMESQTQLLRQDMKVERDAGEAVRLLGEVDDPALKAQLQAALILKFSAAKLPPVPDAAVPPQPLPQPQPESQPQAQPRLNGAGAVVFDGRSAG
ncbi:MULTISPECIES: hypothetical protein [Streptomyces]|uniref:TRADD-N-associated membrane domain-containing protein n=1 Tax=Streptomyces TaxID=1883 RepID=UPI0031CE6DB4